MFINKLKYLSVFFFCLLFCISVFAVPGIPNRFFGTILVNGEPATDGVNVVAKISGVEVASTTSLNGTYGYAPNTFDVLDPNNNRAGKTIEFFVFDVKAGESVFANGEITELNFSVEVEVPPSCGDGICNGDESCSSCPQDCGNCSTPPADTGGTPRGGGGGGGGGLTVSVSEKCLNEDIEVEVKLSNGSPARDATIVIFEDNDDRTKIISGKTDDEGIFVFNLSEIKDYKMEVYKPGYPKNRLSFSVADCTVLDEPIEKEIPLIDDTGPAPAPSNEILGITSDEIDTTQNQKENNTTNLNPSPTGLFGLNLGNATLPVVLIVAVLAVILVLWKVKL